MKDSRAVFLMLVSLVAGFVFACMLPASQQNQPAQGPEQNAQAPQQNPTQVPFPIEGRITVTNQQTPEEQAQAAEESARDNVLITLAFVGAAFAGGAYFAAMRQANAADKALALSSRAYLNPEKWECRIVNSEFVQEIRISFEFANKGQHPGTIRRVAIHLPVRQLLQTEMMVYPNVESYRIYSTAPLNPAEATSLRIVSPGGYAGNVLITRQVLGEVTYFDGFVFRQRTFERVVSWSPADVVFHIPDSANNNERVISEKDASIH